MIMHVHKTLLPLLTCLTFAVQADEILTRDLIPAGNIQFSQLQGGAFASAPGYLIIGDSFGRGTRLWDITRREVMNYYRPSNVLGNTVHGHAISDGRHIELYDSASFTTRLLTTDLETGERTDSVIDFVSSQRALLGAWNNRAAVISYSDFEGTDGTIRVYDTRTGAILHTIRRFDLISPGAYGEAFPTIASGIVAGDALYVLTWQVVMNPDIPAPLGHLHRVDLATGSIGFKTPVAVSRNENTTPGGRGNTYNLAAGDGHIAVAGRNEVTLVKQSTGDVVGVITGLGRTVLNEPQMGVSRSSRYVGGLAIGDGRLFVQAPVGNHPLSSPGVRVFDLEGDHKLDIPNPYAASGDGRPNDFGGSLEYRDRRLFAGQRVWVAGDRIENGDVWDYLLSIPDDDGLTNNTLVYFAENNAVVNERDNLTVELRLKEARGDLVSLTVQSFSSGPNAATPNVDFVPVSETVEFLPGQISATLDVTIIDDTIVEPDETFLLRITDAVGADLGTANIEMVVTIVSDDFDHTSDLIPLATLDAGTRINGVPARPVVNADHILLPYPADGRVLFYDAQTFNFQQNLLSPGGAFGRFGDAIGLDGDLAAIGAPNENGDNGRVYLVDIGGAGIFQTLQNPDPDNLKRFGRQIALEGGFLAITANDGLFGPRRILIYELVESVWTYSREIVSPFPTMNWASSIALSGGELLVPRESGQGGANPPPVTFFDALFQVYDPATGSLLRTYDPVPYRTGNTTLAAEAGRFAVSDTDGVKIRQQDNNSVLFATSEYMPYAPDVAFNGRTAFWSFVQVPVIFYHDLALDRTRAMRFLPSAIPMLPSSVDNVVYGGVNPSFVTSGPIGVITARIPEFLGLFEMDANDDHLVVTHDRSGANPTVFQLPRESGVIVQEASALENAGTVQVEFQLSQQTAQETRIRWTTIDSTAIADTDYISASGTAVIPAGETSVTVEIELIDNDFRDNDRDFNVQVLSVQGASIIDGVARVRILDDETDLDLPIVSLVGSSVVEGNTGYTNPSLATVVFSIDQVQPRNVSFTYTTEPGTAFFSEDYSNPLAEAVISSGKVFELPSYSGMIPAGSLTFTARIPINGDSLAEGPEEFGVSIISVTNGRLPLERTAMVRIADDDRIPIEFRNPNLVGDSAQRGTSVALNGNLLFSGAPGSGFVEVWDITAGTFQQLTPSVSGQYGAAISSFGDHLAAGAWFNATGGSGRGITRLMDLSGELNYQLQPSPINNSGFSGYSLAFAEDGESVLHLLVGSPGDNTNGSNTGSITVFNAETGAQVRKIISPSNVASHRFGEALAADGPIAIVGTQAETAYLVNWTTGAVLHTLTPAESAGLFGRSVAIDGDLALVGASREGTSNSDKGKVFGYNTTTGQPEFVIRSNDLGAPTTSSASWAFGRAMAIQQDRIIVGASRDNTKGLNSGSIYILDRNTLAPVEKVHAPSDFTQQYFGQSLAADNFNVAIGAPLRRTTSSSSLSGSTFLLELTPAFGTFSGAFDLWAGTADFTPDPSGGPGFLAGTSLDAGLAFALGLTADAPASIVNSRLPAFVANGNSRFFEFTLGSNASPNSTLIVEESADLTTWNAVAWRTPSGTWQGPRIAIRENTGPGLIRVRVPAPSTASPKIFQRIRLAVAE